MSGDQGPLKRCPLFTQLGVAAYPTLKLIDEKGQKVEWEIELGAPIILTKQGWTPETVKPGDKIHAKGSPSRAAGTHGLSSMAGGTLTRPDGSRLVAESGDSPFGRGRGQQP